MLDISQWIILGKQSVQHSAWIVLVFAKFRPKQQHTKKGRYSRYQLVIGPIILYTLLLSNIASKNPPMLIVLTKKHAEISPCLWAKFAKVRGITGTYPLRFGCFRRHPNEFEPRWHDLMTTGIFDGTHEWGRTPGGRRSPRPATGLNRKKIMLEGSACADLHDY